MIAHLFPGQGSQQVGMGADLFDAFPQQTAAADEVLGYSIKTLCLEDPQGQLGQTQFTQPALYVVNALSFLARRADGEPAPDCVAGHSLGEFNALFAAGVFDFETGLRMVQRRGALMSQARGGGMAAVLGFDQARVREILASEGLDRIDLANINSPNQIVVAGKADDVEGARAVFESLGARYVTLNVSGAFHSRYMEASRDEFADFVSGMTFNAPTIPVIANATARPYAPGELLSTLTRQIASPVRWCESVQVLMGMGIDTFVEVGPGSVLSGLVRQIRRSAEPIVLDPDTAAGEPAAQPVPSEPAPDESLPVVCGSMFRGISGPEFVAAAAHEGIVATLGTDGLPLDRVEELVVRTVQLLGSRPWAMAVSPSWHDRQREAALIDMAVRHGVSRLEASGYVSVSPALIAYRLSGAQVVGGTPVLPHRVMCKTSRPEVAASFCTPAPADMVQNLLDEGRINPAEADIATSVATATELCAESQGGWLTDHTSAAAVLPTFRRLRDRVLSQGVAHPIRVGLAGGMGSPEAVAAALVMGAEFVVTGSINQCTPEAATSEHVKQMLAACDIQDTTTAPTADGFELGTQMQVMRRGVLVPARAQRLREVYERYRSWDEVDDRTREQIERRVLGESFAQARRRAEAAGVISPTEADPRVVLAGVVRHYLGRCAERAIAGDPDDQVDFLVPTGPAMGALNWWVRGTDLEDWRSRGVGRLNRALYLAALELLGQRA